MRTASRFRRVYRGRLIATQTFTEGQFIVERAVYVMQWSRKVMWVFMMGTVNIHFIVCRSVYRICSDRTWGKSEYGTILQLIIELIHFTVCSSLYRICSDRTWGKYEYGTILQLIIELIHFTVCSSIYRICSDRTWGKYEYGTILQLIIELIHFTVCSSIYRICSDRTWVKYEYETILLLTICRSYLNHYCMGRKTAFFSADI